ncbi:penicillin acylase family protein [SAR202 cluster bacterium AD-804-J14_MRT_500m]|nr:penicillin acylase family protein [SAR202 cluster bacterium AD-804-J14_MRT_500m]
MISINDLKYALPNVKGRVSIHGIKADIQLYRDTLGIPHIKAQSVEDAFFGQGFSTAQDRLWHMDSDRHRAYGRWSEFAGPEGLDQDLLMRRFQLEASAKSDMHAVSQDTIRILDAYSAGVNAFIESTTTLPVEYKFTETMPEPWQPWDCLAVLKVRHIFMGTFEGKLWRASLVKALGAENASKLFPGYEPGHLLILPPGSEYSDDMTEVLDELEKGVIAIDRLNEVEAGSNNWVLSGEHTASGKPLLAGDPHRGLDTPNVYYQNHVSCPQFDVIGASFPGSPGFPHFGHNRWVCWGVTHTGADYQDLYVEQFKQGDPIHYLHKNEWIRASVHKETIKIRGAKDVSIQTFTTLHGPVISGNPESGTGLSFKYTQTDGPNRSADCLLNMMLAKSTLDLDRTMEQWIDPANNFLFADTHGNIGYLTRGKLPIRSKSNAWLPVAGWTGQHEWMGNVAFEEMPRSHNPTQGYIVTANQKPVDSDYPYYIGLDHSPEFRARRITNLLSQLNKATVEDMERIHADRTSIPALHFIKWLQEINPSDKLEREALDIILNWDGNMLPDSTAATIYSAFRLELDRKLLGRLLGPLAHEAFELNGRGAPSHIARLRAHVLKAMDDDKDSIFALKTEWADLISEALKIAVASLKKDLGHKISEWEWGKVHHTEPHHPLASAFSELGTLIDPPSIAMGGDGDTPQNTSYSTGQPYTITTTSVLRYVYDLSDWDNSRWVVPLGSSGHPGSEHYSDQTSTWSSIQTYPMLYDWDAIEQSAESFQILEPKLTED